MDPARTLGHPCRAGGCVGRSVARRAACAGDPWSRRSQRAAAMGRPLPPPATLAIMHLRYNTQGRRGAGAVWREPSLWAAGWRRHISACRTCARLPAQILLEYAGERVIITGELQTRSPIPPARPYLAVHPLRHLHQPRRPSACGSSPIRRLTEENLQAPDSLAGQYPMAASLSAPMRWARRSG